MAINPSEFNKQKKLAFEKMREGKLDDAQQLLQSLLEEQPDEFECWHALGVLYGARENHAKACECFEQLIKLDPDFIDGYCNLGVALLNIGHAEKAVRILKQANSKVGDNAEIVINLAKALLKLGEKDEAFVFANQAVKLAPVLVEAQLVLGVSYIGIKKYESAFKHFQLARSLDEDNLEVAVNLAYTFYKLKEYQRAETYLKRVLNNTPESAMAHNVAGLLLEKKHQYVDAKNSYTRCLKIDPDYFNAHANLGGLLSRLGQTEQSISYLDRAMEGRDKDGEILKNTLLLLNYSKIYSDDEIINKHLQWGAVHKDDALYGWRKGDNYQHKKIRIAYVSGDFKNHSVSYFIENILEHHNRDIFEVYCYSEVEREDSTTDRLKSYQVIWHKTKNHDAKTVAEKIKNDEIDILIDLSGHTEFNRLDVFCLKPSPVQITYIGYPNTTGLMQMDYRITDGIADPETCVNNCSEKLLRNSSCFLNYRPPENAPAISAENDKSDQVRFASFNNQAKIDSGLMNVWVRLLKELPCATLLIKNKMLSDKKFSKEILGYFTSSGIDSKRVILHGYISGVANHLDLYNQVDIHLDTFPYNGTTTTCESLWMGVPVITWKGDSHVSRVGASLLSAVGLNEYIAESEQEYIDKAVHLARNIGERKTLQKNLRHKMQASSLCNVDIFIVGYEKVLLDSIKHPP